MMVNQTEFSRLEQRSLMKFLVAQNYKPCEIYKRMCEVYAGTRFHQIIAYKWAKYF